MESGKQKIQKICDLLKEKTIEPAQEEAKKIIDEAHKKAEKIIKEAKKTAEHEIENVQTEIEQKQKVFTSSLHLACKQAYEKVRQSIENSLFSKELDKLIFEKFTDTKVLSDLITAMLSAIEKEGMSTDLSVYIPKSVSPRKINELLISRFKDKLREKNVIEGDFEAGVKIKLHDQKLTVSLSENELKDLIANFIHNDFRQVVFNI